MTIDSSKNSNRQAKRTRHEQFLPAKNREMAAEKMEVEKELSFSWEAPEYEHEEKNPRWYFLMGGILLLVIIYALWTNSLLMAITFILIGMLGYIYAEREPRMIRMEINSDGIQIDNYFYKHEDLKSFWIFYEVEENIKLLSLHGKRSFLPHIHIPIGDANPILIREVLVEYLPEIRQEFTTIDRLERMIGL